MSPPQRSAVKPAPRAASRLPKRPARQRVWQSHLCVPAPAVPPLDGPPPLPLPCLPPLLLEPHSWVCARRVRPHVLFMCVALRNTQSRYLPLGLPPRPVRRRACHPRPSIADSGQRERAPQISFIAPKAEEWATYQRHAQVLTDALESNYTSSLGHPQAQHTSSRAVHCARLVLAAALVGQPDPCGAAAPPICLRMGARACIATEQHCTVLTCGQAWYTTALQPASQATHSPQGGLHVCNDLRLHSHQVPAPISVTTPWLPRAAQAGGGGGSFRAATVTYNAAP